MSSVIRISSSRNYTSYSKDLRNLVIKFEYGSTRPFSSALSERRIIRPRVKDTAGACRRLKPRKTSPINGLDFSKLNNYLCEIIKEFSFYDIF